MNKLTVINLDKERHLKFDLNALVLIEELSGINLAELGEKVSMKLMKVILYAGLKWEDKDLTPDEVGSLITMDNLKEVSGAIGQAFKGLK